MAFGNKVSGVRGNKRRCKVFLDDREWMEFELQGENPRTVCMATNINTVANVIEKDHYQLVQALTTELEISQESIRQILLGELGMKHACSA